MIKSLLDPPQFSATYSEADKINTKVYLYIYRYIYMHICTVYTLISSIARLPYEFVGVNMCRFGQSRNIIIRLR